MITTDFVGNGKVMLLAGGGKIFTDIAARFVRSERDLENIVSTPYDPQVVRNILQSGHLAATEFDLFIFGVSGYSRVCETQLVRKRLASYLIKSGRAELGGKRQYRVTIPKAIEKANVLYEVETENGSVKVNLNPDTLNRMICAWYDGALETGKFKEEDLRYMKPQATQWQGIIAMNAHSLLDWFSIRCCKNAQAEIRDLANKMLKLCREAAPDLFENAGPNCVRLGYCPENKYQNKACQGKIITKNEALEILKGWKK